jgi:hypothetical protein
VPRWNNPATEGCWFEGCGEIIPRLCRSPQQAFANKRESFSAELWKCCGEVRSALPAFRAAIKPSYKSRTAANRRSEAAPPAAETGRTDFRTYSCGLLVVRRREAHSFNSLLSNFMSLWSLNQRQGK